MVYMAAPARFLFDVDFSAPPEPVAVPVAPPEKTITVSEHEAALAEAVRAAREAGRSEGREGAEAKAAGRLADEAGRLAAAAQSILGILDVERRRIETEATRLAETIARKIAGVLIDRQPRELILAILSDAMAPLRKAPHLVIRLAEADADPIREAVMQLATERGFEGRLVVLGEPGMTRGDCRIEWADGGIVFDRASIEAEITSAIDNHLMPSGEEDGGEAASGVKS